MECFLLRVVPTLLDPTPEPIIDQLSAQQNIQQEFPTIQQNSDLSKDLSTTNATRTIRKNKTITISVSR
jgi:hypothetical protein